MDRPTSKHFPRIDFSRLFARWVIRFEFSNRLMNIPLRFVSLGMQYAILCKLFHLKLSGSVSIGVLGILVFMATSYWLDRQGLRIEVEEASWKRSDAWPRLWQRLDDLEANIGRKSGQSASSSRKGGPRR